MFKKALILFCLFIAFSVNIFAFSIKFDVSMRGNLGQMSGLGSDTNTIRGSTYNLRVYLDNIFVLEGTSVYGASVGAIFGFGAIDQALKTSLWVPEAATKPGYEGDFIGQPAMPIVPLVHLDIGIIGRFFPVNNLSIGFGFVFNVIMNDATYMLSEGNPDFPAGSTGFDPGAFTNALIQPLIGDIVPEMLIEITSTRFFGNIGVDFGMHVSVLFSPILFGIGGSVGVRYRFDPY